MPERFLLQILRSLVKQGILSSTRGVEGGYVLMRDDISVLDVIEAIEGPQTYELVFGEGLPQESRQKLTSALEDVAETARNQLKSIKFAQLVLPRRS
jgi:Rrf2 family protein